MQATQKVALMNKYNFTEPQAKAIIDMKLGRLANLEKVEVYNEKQEIIELIGKLNAILADLGAELRRRLGEIVKTYGDARRTQITQIAETTKEEKEIELVEPEKCVVVMTESGLIKRVPTASFKVQKKAGKGVKTKDDITSAIIRTNTIDQLMIFTSSGKMYRLLVDDIPAGTNASKGCYDFFTYSIRSKRKNRKLSILFIEKLTQNMCYLSRKKGIVKKEKHRWTNTFKLRKIRYSSNQSKRRR